MNAFGRTSAKGLRCIHNRLQTMHSVPNFSTSSGRRKDQAEVKVTGAASDRPSLSFLKPDLQLHPHRDPKRAEGAVGRLLELGYDPESFWEQEIVWGDHDSFQHVNNVRYVRFFESGRIKWMASLGHELGGPTKADAMLKGRGVSLILKSISLNYKAPVTYPDTLLIAHKPHQPPASESERQRQTHMHVRAVAYSYAQKRVVTESESVVVWYDYDKLQKCDPGERVRKIIERRMNLGLDTSSHYA